MEKLKVHSVPGRKTILTLTLIVCISTQILVSDCRILSSKILKTKGNSINLNYPQEVIFYENKEDFVHNSSIHSSLIHQNQNQLDTDVDSQIKTVDRNTKSKEKLKQGSNAKKIGSNEYSCALPQSLVDEIASYANISNLIINTVKDGIFKGKTYRDLQKFVDKFGSRLSGTANLESAIDYMLDFMKERNLNVSAEEADVPNWVRGKEEATMLLPRKKSIKVLGLGFTVGTPPEGITAEVLVVRSFEELAANAKLAQGKIIVYNQDFVSYGETVKYRSQGAVEAAKVGGLAALIRSITPFSLYTPHTGMMSYAPNVTQIPAACITIEDAQLLDRLQKLGQRIVISLNMNDFTLPLKTSRNAIGEIQGKEKPDEIVVVSGHIDSWDVGQGALDDGGGMIISAQALTLINFLNLRPRRTLRAILWTAEEFGLWGVQSYVANHRNEMEKFKAVFESDIGTFKPLGLDFAGTPEAGCIVQEVLKLLTPINATQFRLQDDVGSDIYYFLQKNVPGLSLNNENSKYFWYHHTESDTMTILKPDELDLCTAVWAVSSYVLADLSVELPRKA